MSIRIYTSFNGKCHEVYVGDLTLLFSYETLVGFAIPGVGRVKRENVWGPTTGKHLNSWPAKYEKVQSKHFQMMESLFDQHLSGTLNRDDLVEGVLYVLNKTEDMR